MKGRACVTCLAAVLILQSGCDTSYVGHEEEKPDKAPGTRPPRPVQSPPVDVELGETVRVPGYHQGAVERDFGLGDDWSDISIAIKSPKRGEVVATGNVPLQVDVQGYDPKDGTLLLQVVVDNESAKTHRLTDDNPIPLRLNGRAPGLHRLRVFLARPWHESIKIPKAFAQTHFYYGERDDKPAHDSKPALTYSRPQGTYRVTPETNRVLLDFFVSGAELGEHSYKVRYTVDGREPIVLTNWVPVWLEGLPAGEHRLRIELIDGKDKIVPGAENSIERTFTIAPSGPAGTGSPDET